MITIHAIRAMRKLILHLAISCLCFPAACASAERQAIEPSKDAKCEFSHEIKPASIGPVRLGHSLNSHAKAYTISQTTTRYTNEPAYRITFCDGAASVVVEVENDETIVSIATNSPEFKTIKGAKVGMSLVQLQKAHPEGAISTGIEEGGWVAFRLEEFSGYFEFSIKNVEISCLKDNETCNPDFFNSPSISYETLW